MHCLLGKAFLGLQKRLPSAGVLGSLFKPRLRMPSWQKNFNLDFLDFVLNINVKQLEYRYSSMSLPDIILTANTEVRSQVLTKLWALDLSVDYFRTAQLFSKLRGYFLNSFLKQQKKYFYFFPFLNKIGRILFTFDLKGRNVSQSALATLVLAP